MGDVLTAVSRNTDSVIVAKLTTVVEVGRQFDFKIATAQHQYENLFEVDSLLREGTPLFKEGKLAGITLLGQRFLGEGTNKSYVVPAERLLAICQKLDAEADAAAGKTLKPAQEISDPDLPPDFKLSVATS